MYITRRAQQIQPKGSMIRGEKLTEFQGMHRTADVGERDFGLAVDIGTTTVAVSLYQLKTNRLAGSWQDRNRQTCYGSDVMMRLMHCQRGYREKLQGMLVAQLEQAAAHLSKNVCRMCDIKKMAVVGNTVMCHIFAGKDVDGLAGSPFQPSYRGALECSGGMLGFRELSQAQIYILAGVDAHVGADAVSMATVLGFFGKKEIQLAIDIGTNAELVLMDSRGSLVACSVPAGPAFEGMEISCGMRGVTGAVSGVRFAPQAGNIILDVIDSRRNQGHTVPAPAGLCGSGLIDAVAQLRQWGLVRGDGYLLSEREALEEQLPSCLAGCIRENGGERGFLLYPGRESEKPVILTQRDIRQFQLAKAAVQAGTNVLLSSQGVSLEQVEHIWIAGVFGGHISKKSAVKTGLFPNVPPEKLSVVGNAAGEGAALALLCQEFRRISEQLAGRAGHLELASSREFQKEFMAAMEL